MSNLFAGFYLTLDRLVRVGDFVRLESGQEGYIDEIGWRNTRMRLLPTNEDRQVNSLLIIMAADCHERERYAALPQAMWSARTRWGLPR